MTVPKTLGKYQIESLLGKGAFAEVYRAMDTSLKRTVALKVLKPALLADEEAFARFVQEAQILANLVHPYIAWVWDLGEADGRYFIARRYVDGKSLDRVIVERGALPWEEALKITQNVAEALVFAHEQGLVHRDVKPQNIIIGEKEGAVLTDFGLVKALYSSGMSSTASMIGTPSYIAPEIWEGESASPASDQYALACVVVEMLTGKVLFGGTTPAIMKKHFLEPLSLPEKLPEGAPQGVLETLQRALNKRASDRYPSMAEFVAGLKEPVKATDLPVEGIQEEPIRDDLAVRQAETLVDSAPARVEEIMSTREHLSVKLEENQVESVSAAVQVGKIQKIREETPARQEENQLILTLAPSVEMVFMRVSAGEFSMGSDDADDDEKPMHKMYLDEYWMGKYPVTNRQYLAFVKSAGHIVPNHWKEGAMQDGQENHPVVNVSWKDAQAFCNWASQVSGKKIYLPAEAEWEKAARGTDRRKYPWGDQAPDATHCNFLNNVKDTTPVGCYSPKGDSPCGCVDMAGNVWEWVNDWYDTSYYRQPSHSNPPGPTSESKRVLRGGAWGSVESSVRSTDRGRGSPGGGDGSVGFRCACSIPKEG